MTRVLFIAYYFPPLGGGGVQRSCKFVKYLPEFGIQPLVLTGPGKKQDHWTPEDASLMAEVPESTPVFRATWEHGNREQRWNALLDLGDQIIRNEKPGLIFVTLSPFRDAMIASELARRHGLPWVADLRDPWALDEFQVYRSRWHRMLERRKMGASLRTASAIILNTPEAERRFRMAFPNLAGKVTGRITNGYDAEDFSRPVEKRRTDQFTIVHSGYFHAEYGLRQQQRRFEYRLLGRTEPGVEFLSRSHFYLLQALERWREESPEIAQTVRVICVGSATQTDQRLVEQSSVADLFEFTGYRPHNECVDFVRQADLLFLPLHTLPKGRRATIVPGKTYEYMASGRRILAAVPEGDTRDYVAKAQPGLICEPGDIQGMGRILRSEHARWQRDDSATNWNRTFVEAFERRTLTGWLAEELHRCSPRGSASIPRQPAFTLQNRGG